MKVSDRFLALIATWTLFSVTAAFCFQPGGMDQDGQAAEESIRTCVLEQGGIIRGPRAEKKIALIFTGGDFADGGGLVRRVLARAGIKASFFFTGDGIERGLHHACHGRIQIIGADFR